MLPKKHQFGPNCTQGRSTWRQAAKSMFFRMLFDLLNKVSKFTKTHSFRSRSRARALGEKPEKSIVKAKCQFLLIFGPSGDARETAQSLILEWFFTISQKNRCRIFIEKNLYQKECFLLPEGIPQSACRSSQGLPGAESERNLIRNVRFFESVRRASARPTFGSEWGTLKWSNSRQGILCDGLKTGSNIAPSLGRFLLHCR